MTSNVNELKLVKEIMSKYRNKFKPSESSKIIKKNLEENSIKKLEYSLTRQNEIDSFPSQLEKDKNNMFSNTSFKINQENVNNRIISKKVPEKSPVLSPSNKNNNDNFSDNNIDLVKSNLNVSISQMEMVNTVKKAMELNSNYINAFKISIKDKNPLLKSNMSSSFILDTSMNNNTDQFLNNIKTSIQASQSALNHANKNKMEIVNLNNNVVSQIDERINNLRKKIKLKKKMKIDFKSLNKLREEDELQIFKMMNFGMCGLWNSCKYLRKMVLNKFISWSNKISSQFETTFKNILCIKDKKLVVYYNKKRQLIMFDLLIKAEILTKIYDQTVRLISNNGYHFSNDIYKNIYQFDLKKRCKSTYWATKEFTYFHEDDLQKAYNQPIMTFSEKDNIQLSVSLLSERGIININSFKWLPPYFSKIIEPDNSSSVPERSDADLSRKCEIEMLKNRWSDIVNFENKCLSLEKIKEIFNKNFTIENILFDDVGYFLFKITLIASKPGTISYCQEIGLSIQINEENNIVTNEVKKNFLIFDKLNQIQLRMGDKLIFYYTVNKK